MRLFVTLAACCGLFASCTSTPKPTTILQGRVGINCEPERQDPIKMVRLLRCKFKNLSQETTEVKIRTVEFAPDPKAVRIATAEDIVRINSRHRAASKKSSGVGMIPGLIGGALVIGMNAALKSGDKKSKQLQFSKSHLLSGKFLIAPGEQINKSALVELLNLENLPKRVRICAQDMRCGALAIGKEFRGRHIW